MGADLFESYSGSIIAPIALAAFIPVLVVNGVTCRSRSTRCPSCSCSRSPSPPSAWSPRSSGPSW
jgi:hypothetical protein